MVTQSLKLNTLPQNLTPFPLNFIPTELREDGFQPQTYLVQGVKALHTALKLWMKKEVSSCLWWNNLIFIWQGQESDKCEIVSLSVVSTALCNPMDCSPSRLLCPWNRPGRNTGVGSHSLSSQPRDWIWVSCAAGKFFTIWAIRETVNFHMARSGKQSPYAILSLSGSGRRNRNHALTEKYNLCFISIYRCAGFCLYSWEWST